MKRTILPAEAPAHLAFTLELPPREPNSQERLPHEKAPPQGRIPRLSRLMALAIRFERLVKKGQARDYAELARAATVTRARVTQILNLLWLAPDIQEDILFLPLTYNGHDPIAEKHIRHITTTPYWLEQRIQWQELKRHLPKKATTRQPTQLETVDDTSACTPAQYSAPGDQQVPGGTAEYA